MVLNTAHSMARDCGLHPLVIEADLYSGVLALLLNVPVKTPIIDSLHRAATLDSHTWAECVSQASGFELLLTDRISQCPLPTWVNYHQPVRHAAPRYDALLVDFFPNW